MVFTINNPTVDQIADHSCIPWRSSVNYYVCSLEVGDGGTPHLQGYVRWKSAKSYKRAQDILGAGYYKSARGTALENWDYCTKDKSHISGPWQSGYPERRPLPVELHAWQVSATDLVSTTPNDRDILWIEGPPKTGKTTLQHIWVRDFDALYVSGSCYKDIACAIALSWLPPDGSMPTNPIVMLNLPRRMRQTAALWPLLESLKDGLLFSGKYKSQALSLPLLHLVVFANEAPTCSSLSPDKLIHFRLREISLSQGLHEVMGPMQKPD